jgi:gluconolactonase
MASGKITVLADRHQGKPLGAPNDLDIDARGRVYFTSRLANRDPKTGNVNAVYRIDPDGALTRILALPAIDMPNGIVTSPDDTLLYLIDADGQENRARRIRVYDLKPDGTVTNERLLYDFYPGRSGDGMAVDAEGNLYVAAGLHRRRGTRARRLFGNTRGYDYQLQIRRAGPPHPLCGVRQTPVEYADPHSGQVVLPSRYVI